MKRRLILALLALALLLASCAPNAAILYENNFDDMDIAGRVDAAAYSIQTGDTSRYLLGQLEAIELDLNSLSSENSEVEAINALFLSCIDQLKEAYYFGIEGDADEKNVHYTAAQQLYRQANKRLNDYKRQLEAEAEGE